jgi:hypothetical protein
MSKTVIRVLENVTGRRAFLKKASTVGGALLAGVFGATQKAEACNYCCALIFNPSSCTWNNPPCGCVWRWECPHYPDCRYVWCEECFAVPVITCPGDTFANVICSRVTWSQRKISNCTPQ